jgi:gamma-glutamylcyclotransferase (GGCT)/AIG2-like uncharacterized protein YtfP
MSKDIIYVFSYGTIQAPFSLHQRINLRSGAQMEIVESKVKIKGWGLCLSDKGPYPIAFQDLKSSITGSIIACTSEQVRIIVEIESDYFIKIIPVEVDDVWYNCLFFYGYRQNEKIIKSGNFLWIARRHNLACLNKKK